MSQNTPVSRAICERLFANPDDEGAWEAFWTYYWPAANGWAFAMTRCKGTADDIATGVFERLFLRLTDPKQPRVQLDESGSFKKFILAIATNLVRDWLESPAKSRTVHLTDAELARLEGRDRLNDLEGRLDALDILDRYREAYKEALRQLKAAPQFSADSFRVFLLVYHDDKKRCEVDREFGLDTGLASKTANRMWKRLLALMKSGEPATNEPRMEVLLEELVRTYGDLSD